MKRTLTVFAVVGCLVGRSIAAELPPDLSAVPGNAAVFVHVRIADIYRGEHTRHLREFIAKAGPEALKAFAARFPFNPASLDRVTVFVVLPAPDRPPIPSIVIRLSQPFDEARLVAALAPQAETAKAGAIPIYVDRQSDMAIRILDNQTFQIGQHDGLPAIVAGAKSADGPLAALLAQAGGKPVFLGVNSAAIPPQLRAQIPAPAVPIAKLKVGSLSIDWNPHAVVALRLSYPDAESAADAEQMVHSLIELGRSALVGARAELQKQLDGDGKPATIEEFPAATAALLGLGSIRQYEEILKKLPLKRDGTDLSLTLDLPAGLESNLVATSAISTALLLPAVQRVREVAARNQTKNDLKLLALAMHIYHDANGSLPPQAIMSKDGKTPLLSWRVAILPYIEQEQLYKQFHLEESWDSEHNKKLIPLMPKVFGSAVAPQQRSSGKTFYQVLVGGGAPWDRGPKGQSLAKFTDGTSNTIMIAEAGDPVIWTKPDDLTYEPKKPLPRFGNGVTLDGFLVAFADGSVRTVSPKVREATLRALITANGGEVIGPDWNE